MSDENKKLLKFAIDELETALSMLNSPTSKLDVEDCISLAIDRIRQYTDDYSEEF